MRRSCSTLWPFVLVGLVACARPTPAPRSGDALVLELGGGQASLRQALVAAGVLAAPKPAPEVEPGPGPAVDPEPPPPIDAVPVPPRPDHILVELGRGETLIHLAKKYLGDGNRFRDILTANGWTEQDARRLPAGQLVRVPVDPSSAPMPR